MRYRRLDAAGDYAFGRGLSDFEQDTPEAVAQAVKTRLALRFGEWFLDTSDGRPSTGRFGSGFWGRKASRASTAMYAPLTRTRAHCRFRRTSTRSMARQW